MKKLILTFSAFALLTSAICSQEDPIVEAYKTSAESEKKDDKDSVYRYTKEKIVPSKTRPSKKSSDKTYEDKSENYLEECSDTFKYGLEGQISELLDELTKNEDTRFVDEIYDLFYETKDMNIKIKILGYFTKLKDPCLKDYVCEVINDPYDQRSDVVDACFKYAADTEVVEAVPGLVDLVDKEEDGYFNGALSALGELGGSDEAQFLSEYLDRDDLSVSQKQSLMRVLGRIKAVETWDKLAEIAQDEDENSFVRMYAAEAIGAMGKAESEEILLKLYESNDSNFRGYVLKGLSHFDTENAKKVIIQALRDSQYKVRLEAINCVEEKNMKEAVPYLIYRCKDKSEEKPVKEKCYKTIAKFNTSEGNEYLISLITDRKTGDGIKSKVAAALMEFDNAGTKEIIDLAKSTMDKDAQKSLRYALGKEFAKYGRSSYSEICEIYLDHNDVATQGTGLDIWAKGHYSNLSDKVNRIAQDAIEDVESEKEAEKDKKRINPKKKNANAKKAKKILEAAGYTVSRVSEKETPAPAVDAVTGAN